MAASPGTGLAALALAQGEGEALWFGNSLATIKADGEATGGHCAVIEVLSPQGNGPPLHVHRNEDEWFYVLEGEMVFWVDGRTVTCGPGSFAFAPRNLAHTYTVTSPTVRYVVVAQPAGFDQFVRALSVPAKTRTLPPATVEQPTPDCMTDMAAKHKIEILGPPGLPK
jgi:quercetin dioxygenase-like cupin family protein